MNIKIYLAAILLFLCSAQFGFAQEKVISKAIINGSAIFLPKPAYTKQAQDFCASGQVQVEVLVGEDGNIISAKAISGDELLRDSAVKAAMKAKFASSGHIQLVKVRGVIVYNFVPEIKCIGKGIVNKKAVYLLKPVYPKSCRCSGNVVIQIVIDQSGNVISARAISGHPLLQISALESARKAKFAPTLINGGNQFYVKAMLVYDFNSNSSMQTDTEKEQKQTEIPKGKTILDLVSGTVIGAAINLVKPPAPSCHCTFGNTNGTTVVMVQAEIDEKGNVSKATAISGHPVLRTGSQLAAQNSKFMPSLIRGSPVKAKAIIVYKFTIVNKWAVKFASVEIKDTQIENQPAN